MSHLKAMQHRGKFSVRIVRNFIFLFVSLLLKECTCYQGNDSSCYTENPEELKNYLVRFLRIDLREE